MNEELSSYKKQARLDQIDILKGLAIISVILLHTWPKKLLLITGAPFHIWQAVPIFIIIAGYVGTLSYKRHQQNIKLHQLYNTKLLSRRIKRIIAPFFVIFSLQYIYIYIYIYNVSAATPNIIISFIVGGHGPGSYFVPIIIQHILLLPFLYVWAVQHPKYFIPLTFLISLILEQLMILLAIPPEIYRLLYVRYFFAGALGVWLAASNKNKQIKILIFGAFLSIIYIFAINYLNYQSSIIYPAWLSQHSPSYLWTMLIIVAGISYFPEKATNFIQSTIKKLGQASWHIFLVQMTYFWALGSQIKSLFFSGLSFPNSLNIQTLTEISIMVSALTILNLTICLYAGHMFYKKFTFTSS